MKQSQSTVEILIVGNELLNGTTLDTNSHWLSKQLVKIGATVTRKETISDNLKEISKAFKAALGRKPSWIFSLGGLGPTYDDMTLEGLAMALGREIERNEDAVKMIKERYKLRREANPDLPKRILPASLKMADIPRGAIPLRNSAGTAPGVLFRKGSTRIVSLPGVPREMKAIFAEQVAPLLKEDIAKFGRSETWLNVSGISESMVAPHIQRLMRSSPSHIYIKSHPVGFRKGLSILKFQISATFSAENREQAKYDLKRVAGEMERIVRKLGGNVDARSIK